MKPRHILPILFLLLSACTLPLQYTGDKLPPTNHADIYYQGQPIKREYKVIGRLQSHKYIKSAIEKNMTIYAKKYGGDAVIISPAQGDRINADVIKYIN